MGAAAPGLEAVDVARVVGPELVLGDAADAVVLERVLREAAGGVYHVSEGGLRERAGVHLGERVGGIIGAGVEGAARAPRRAVVLLGHGAADGISQDVISPQRPLAPQYEFPDWRCSLAC